MQPNTTKHQLVLLPYAGGGKQAYRQFQPHAHEHDIELVEVLLPGRDARYAEQPITSIHHMVNDIYQQLQGRLHANYAIFGHSMGGLLGYLLTIKLLANGHTPPTALYISGKSAPVTHTKPTALFALPRHAFQQTLIDYGRLPKQVLNAPKLFNMFEGYLRADFEAYECYIHKKQPQPFEVPIHLFLGDDDFITVPEGMAWQRETEGAFHLHQLSGDHFFIFEHAQKLMNYIQYDLTEAPVAAIP